MTDYPLKGYDKLDIQLDHGSVARPYRSSYGTYIVTVDGRREYETTSHVKAAGVAEYLASKEGAA
jgi:hypothetical protein